MHGCGQQFTAGAGHDKDVAFTLVVLAVVVLAVLLVALLMLFAVVPTFEVTVGFTGPLATNLVFKAVFSFTTAPSADCAPLHKHTIKAARIKRVVIIAVLL